MTVVFGTLGSDPAEAERSGPGGEPNARALQRDPARVEPTGAGAARLVAVQDLRVHSLAS
jgi:hypothetical protein